MARILLQTTIPDVPDDWHVGRFSLLAGELRRAGHEVTARNRAADDVDPVLSTLDVRDHDQLWLIAVDTGRGLSGADAAGILRFREQGGGILTARDHHDLGACLLQLGTIGRLNHFHSANPESDPQRDDQDNLGFSWPNYHSGANGDYQPVEVVEPVHDLVRTDDLGGWIAWFPAHPHEGAVDAPLDVPAARVVARGRSTVTGREFNLVVCVDGEVSVEGAPLGRVVACSTFHHLADMNWDTGRGAPSFVTDLPGDDIRRDPARLGTFKGFVRNVATWLGGSAADP